MPSSHPFYYAYIVQCTDGTYYAGKTYDLALRIKQHNGLVSGGAIYTRSRKPVKLVYYEQCATNAIACQREAYLKQLSRQQKEQLIKEETKEQSINLSNG